MQARPLEAQVIVDEPGFRIETLNLFANAVKHFSFPEAERLIQYPPAPLTLADTDPYFCFVHKILSEGVEATTEKSKLLAQLCYGALLKVHFPDVFELMESMLTLREGRRIAVEGSDLTRAQALAIAKMLEGSVIDELEVKHFEYLPEKSEAWAAVCILISKIKTRVLAISSTDHETWTPRCYELFLDSLRGIEIKNLEFHFHPNRGNSLQSIYFTKFLSVMPCPTLSMSLVNFNQTPIQQIKYFWESIAANPHIKRFNLSSVVGLELISDEAWEFICNILSKAQITSLCLKHMRYLSLNRWRSFVEAIVMSHISELEIDAEQFTRHTEEEWRLIKILMNKLTHLRLNYPISNLNSDQIRKLANLLQDDACTLTSLQIDINYLPDESWEALLEMIKKSKVKHLDISDSLLHRDVQRTRELYSAIKYSSIEKMVLSKHQLSHNKPISRFSELEEILNHNRRKNIIRNVKHGGLKYLIANTIVRAERNSPEAENFKHILLNSDDSLLTERDYPREVAALVRDEVVPHLTFKTN